jgi:NADH-quinone oxidoreductase subunit E
MSDTLRVGVEHTLEVEIAKRITRQYNYAKEKLLSILLDIQKESGKNYISEKSAITVAQELDMPISKLYDVISFYAMLNLEPKGKYIIEICKSPICHVNSCRSKAKIFEKLLGIQMGETTPDGLFTLEYTSCFGACDLGPAAKIGEKVYGNLDTEKIENIINSYRGEAICQK